jgi:hypothetical protein
MTEHITDERLAELEACKPGTALPLVRDDSVLISLNTTNQHVTLVNIGMGNDKANRWADYIVTACNAFPSLVAALRAERQRADAAERKLVERDTDYEQLGRHIEAVLADYHNERQRAEAAEESVQKLASMLADGDAGKRLAAAYLTSWDDLWAKANRLAAAEQRCAELERERDEWKAKLTPEYAIGLGHIIMADWRQTVIAERDAIKDKLAAATARAEAAEKEVKRIKKAKNCYYECVSKTEADERIDGLSSQLMDAHQQLAAVTAERDALVQDYKHFIGLVDRVCGYKVLSEIKKARAALKPTAPACSTCANRPDGSNSARSGVIQCLEDAPHEGCGYVSEEEVR